MVSPVLILILEKEENSRGGMKQLSTRVLVKKNGDILPPSPPFNSRAGIFKEPNVANVA
jgi:hypothetical protein